MNILSGYFTTTNIAITTTSGVGAAIVGAKIGRCVGQIVGGCCEIACKAAEVTENLCEATNRVLVVNKHLKEGAELLTGYTVRKAAEKLVLTATADIVNCNDPSYDAMIEARAEDLDNRIKETITSHKVKMTEYEPLSEDLRVSGGCCGFIVGGTIGVIAGTVTCVALSSICYLVEYC